MECIGTDRPVSEYEFVRSVGDRDHGAQCRGPLVTLSFAGYSFDLLEESLHEHPVRTWLWAGFDPTQEQMTYTMCAVHWMDVSYVAGVHAYRHRRSDWLHEASALLDRVCYASKWDTKEMSNLLTWQRMQLTQGNSET